MVLPACNRNGTSAPSKPAGPPEVAVVPARAARVPVIVELPGRTNPYRVAQVRARVDGIVLKREFREGADVKTGQRLYQIDPGPYQAALASAQATLGRAKANVGAVNAQAARYKQLVVTRAVSQQEYDNAVASLGQALADVASGQAQVRTASINLGYTDVTAPITGRVGISQVTEGAYVQASQATLMTTIQQIDPIYVDLNQSSVEGLRLRREVASGKVKTNGPGGATVNIILEDGTQYPLPGRLEFTDITVDPGTGSVTLRVIVPNPDHLLLPGMFMRARVEEGTVEDAVLVPQVGVSHTPQGQAAVLLVGPDGKVVQRTVQASRTLGSDWVVTGGLQAGENVIVSGLQRAQPGTQVRVVQAHASGQAAPRR
ncbi:MAG: efflux RND transporter periplasmic adaptor subunit [Telluria sp.]